MNEIDINDSMAVKEAQELILEFVRDFFDEKVYAEVLKTLKECPVYFLDPKEDERLGVIKQDKIYDCVNVLAKASDQGLFLPISAVSYNDIEFSRDITLSLIIHEYAHILRRMNSSEGIMFEEGFATVFAEACIIHSEIKKQKSNGQTISQRSVFFNASPKYKKAESQIRSILYILHQNGLDMKLIGEYIFGDEKIFLEKCIQIFGADFEAYFKLANSINDEYYNDYEDEEHNSNLMLINIIANYIKEKGLSIANYFDSNYILEYNKLATSLFEGISKAGKYSFKEEDYDAFDTCELLVKRIKEEEKELQDERRQRIEGIAKAKYSLNGKSIDEIYNILVDMCSQYYQRNNRKENKMFISEIERLFPNIAEFAKAFVKLRYYDSSSSSVLAELDITKEVTYEQIFSIVLSKLEEYKLKELVDILKVIFNNCNTKEKLLDAIAKISKYQDKIDITKLYPNYNDFCLFVNNLDNELSDIFDSQTDLNYDILYNKLLHIYISKKEQELSHSEELESIYQLELESMQKLYQVIVNENSFLEMNYQNNSLKNSLVTCQHSLDIENEKRRTSVNAKDNILSRRSELQKRNVIIRLFKRKEIKSLTNQIDDIEQSIQNSDIVIENTSSEIEDLQGKIKSNEQELIELCGLSFSEYITLLEECKKQNLTKGQLLERIERVKKQIEVLGIPSQKKHLLDLYEKNGITKQDSMGK